MKSYATGRGGEMRKNINYPELLKEYLAGEKCEYLAAKYGIHSTNVHVIVRRLKGQVRPKGRPKWRTSAISADVN